MSDPGAITARIGDTPYQVTLGDGTHEWASDEPVALGGANTAPDPTQILVSALGACTSITLKMYAGRKEWPLEEVHVTLTMTQDNAGTHIQRHIEVSGDLTDEQRTRLLQIANACPVHRIMSGEISIDSFIAAAT